MARPPICWTILRARELTAVPADPSGRIRAHGEPAPTLRVREPDTRPPPTTEHAHQTPNFRNGVCR